MRRLLLGALLLCALAAGAWFLRPLPPLRDEPPPPPSSVWLGSAGCASCHAEIHATWSRTNHALSIRPFAPEIVPKEWDGERFEGRGVSTRLGPGPAMETQGPGGATARFPVEQVIGLRRVQMFLTSMPGGRLQVLPVFLEVQTRKWFDYADFIFGMPQGFTIAPDSSNSWYVFARNFNSRCGECHHTGYEVGYDADHGSYATTWQEDNISCESCHGPGAAHAHHWRTLATGRDPILNPSKMTAERANQVCGYCHAEREEVVPGFLPGDDLFAFTDVHGLEDEKHLHPDGRARELIHNMIPTRMSRCRTEDGAPLRCSECHDPHGRGIPGDLRRPLLDDESCLRCHEQFRGRIEEHTHHPAASVGSRCVSCHMPPLLIEGGHGRVRDHTISIPSPRNRSAHGIPNACADCHLDKEPGWDRARFDEFYPGAEERNHRVRLAQTVAWGRAGDPRGREPLLALLRDENPVYRAGATWMLSRYGVDVRPQLSDGDPMVRRAAIAGIAATHPDALLPLLDGDNATLRRAAAAALVDPARYEALRAQPERIAKLLQVLEPFMRLRPDAARFHKAIAALHVLRGDKAAARASYERYLLLQPWDSAVRKYLEGLK